MNTSLRKFLTVSLCAGCLALTSATTFAQSSTTAPKTVIHVVTLNWKADATEAQIKAALDGVHALTKDYPGILRVWTKAIGVQGDKKHAFVMEFKDEAALKAYSNSPAQKKWYEVYLGVRDSSTTFDITN